MNLADARLSSGYSVALARPSPASSSLHTSNQNVGLYMFQALGSLQLTDIRVVFALFIISKAGGLIYNREFHSGLTKLTSNDYLMLAGSFHG